MVNGCRIQIHRSSRSGNQLMSINKPDLCPEAASVIWRIIGPGESPIKNRSAYDQIEPVISKYVSTSEVARAIAEIKGWFESHGDQQWLKSERSEQVAVLILEGVKDDLKEETAIWSIGSIDVDLAVHMIPSLWTAEAIDLFIKTAITTLKDLCVRDEVLDASRCSRFAAQDSIQAKVPKEAVLRKGRLETFCNLNNHSFELVVQGLYPAVGNLIELVLELRPDQFESLIEKLDHPVVQARAADCMVTTALPRNHSKTLEWIGEGSCDVLIALAIVHTLDTVNKLDKDIRLAERSDVEQYTWSTELHLPRDDLNSAATDLITGLVNQLAVLEPMACTRWIGELLSDAPSVFHIQGNDKPPRINQLEMACTGLMARIVCQSWSDYLLSEFRAGLCISPQPTWTRHLAKLAWEIHDVDPARAAKIAQLTLDEHAQHIARELERNHLNLNWSYWQDREWIECLSTALVLSCENLDLLSWVSVQCQALPLSVWVAEENNLAFYAADQVAQHWFLIAFHSVHKLKVLGRKINPDTIRNLAEFLWAHYHFTGQHIGSQPANSDTAELAARFAIEFGELSDSWLLDSARNPGVGPRALWALIDQRRIKGASEVGTDVSYDELISTEFVRIASVRFGDGGQFNLGELQFWGRLWLLLGAVNEAEQTGIAIIRFQLTQRDRTHKIMLLKLFAMVDSKRKLSPEFKDYTVSLYRQVWPSYTPEEERLDRQQIDNLLG